jgi:hypothetical protein
MLRSIDTMKRTLMTVLCLISISQLAALSAGAMDAGFETGNSFTAREFLGQVSVMCMAPDDHSSYFYACDTDGLDPSLTAKFVTAPGTDADHVTLSSTWENGKTVTKDTGFDSANGKSTKAFNLWMSTLFQRPLLNSGTNKIHYVLSKNGQTQSEGDFAAIVQSAPASQCGMGTLTEFSSVNCRNSIYMCQRFFDEAANCN